MKRYKCFLLDDLPAQFKVLEVYIKQHEDLILIGKETNPQAFLEQFNAGLISTDILFLDVEMPGISGLEIAELVGPDVKVIFTTAYRDYALDAYDLNVVDYLLKPIKEERFIAAVDKAISSLLSHRLVPEPEDLVIPGRDKGSWIRLKYGDIIYIKSDSNYMNIYTQDKMYMYYNSLERIINNFPKDTFLRVHRSYVINLYHIHKGTSTLIKMSNEDKLPIGRTYRKQVLHIILGYNK